MIAAALYARYSSDNQRVESITAQLRRGREYCKKHGYAIVKEYCDEAFTGTNVNRPAFQKMLEDAKKHLFQVLVVHKPDRFGRNEFDYYSSRAKLEASGVELVFTGQQFDMTTPEGRLMENQLVGFAAFYSRNLSNEIKKGQRENAYQGKSTNGSCAYGFKTDKDKKIVIDEEKAPAVRQIFSMYGEGHGYSDILAWLNDHGYRTAKGNLFGTNSLHDILVNPRYIGTAVLGRNVPMPNGKRNSHRPLHDGCIVVENAHAAIIDMELWKRVEARMSKNRRQRARFKAKRPYPLSGMIVCGECGSSMVGNTSINAKRYETRWYRCNHRMRRVKGETVCKARSVPAKKIETFVYNRIMTILGDPAFIKSIAGRVREAYSQLGTTRDKKLAELRPRREKLRQYLNRLYDLAGEGAMDEYDRGQIIKVKTALRNVEAELADVESQPAVPLLSDKALKNYVKMYLGRKFSLQIGCPADGKQKSAEKIRALMERLVEKVTVYKDSLTISYKFGFNWCDWSDSNARPTA